ncbi:hypothetical protein ACQPYE_26200 [Actinosynnema sp. CA-299493]
MKPNDLGEVLRDRAELPETTHDVRMAALRSRVRKVRRRRAFVAVTCVVLALVGGGLAATPSRPDSQPATPPPFPEYLSGSRVVAQTSGRTPDPLTLAFTPSDPAELTLLIGCDASSDRSLKVAVAIDDREIRQWACYDGDFGFSDDKMRDSLKEGRPAVVRLTVLGRITSGMDVIAEDAEVEPAEDGIELRVGVGRKVPLARYPMPPAPEKPIEVDGHVWDADIVLRSDPADPNLPRTAVVPWRRVTALEVVYGSPGRISVLINGVTVDDSTSYSYGVAGSIRGGGYDSPDLVPGDPVDISVIPEAQHGEWAVMVEMEG